MKIYTRLKSVFIYFLKLIVSWFEKISIIDELLKLSAIAFFMVSTAYILVFMDIHFLHSYDKKIALDTKAKAFESYPVAAKEETAAKKQELSNKKATAEISADKKSLVAIDAQAAPLNSATTPAKISPAKTSASTTTITPLVDEKISAETTTEPFNNETVLAIISTLAIFSGMLVYIFKKIVRTDLMREVAKASKNAIHDERIASKIEARILTSFVMTKLYRIYTHMETKDNPSKDRDMASSIKDKPSDILNIAIEFDKSSSGLYGNLYSTEYRDIFIKVRNNLGNNLTLKYAGMSNSDKINHIDYEKDREDALAVKKNLMDFFEHQSYTTYHDITARHFEEFKKTYNTIKETFKC